ncbi:hypothetical protein [Corynebacterium lowii]|uniref:Uncharacterized protein n=1 Tax=Corynebacterium lowii TaxID=1544413 RepID=A0A0Q1AIT8_9CORY|nr:hypothetical protein [Corynebacterium lowii]KQB86648.1 hypothetical protein Clow_00856 [Corynebacterium lowii]MDP9851333.1 hypothetical protein [Corynebacterium lowii]
MTTNSPKWLLTLTGVGLCSVLAVCFRVSSVLLGLGVELIFCALLAESIRRKAPVGEDRLADMRRVLLCALLGLIGGLVDFSWVSLVATGLSIGAGWAAVLVGWKVVLGRK